jgi:LacI family transcriptional regulator
MLRTIPTNGGLPWRRPRVALLIESSRAYGRGTLMGVSKYIRQHGPWSIFFQDQGLGDRSPPWLENWEGDGILARVENLPMAAAIRRVGVPAVDLRYLLPNLNLPSVRTDDAAATALAWEHLRERGFRHFAYCGFNGADYSDIRRDQFAQKVSQTGLCCHVYVDPNQPGHHASTRKHEELGLSDGDRVAQWIKELPKPIGLMACNDMRGQQILNACRSIGVAVPDEVAVIGVDNDEVLCEMSDPPLSSVVANTERIGYEAAALLDRLMSGSRAPTEPIVVGPLGIVTRHSSDVLAVDDRHIAAAVRFIRERACEGVDVGDVLRAVPLSRSALERRFAKALNRSPKEEILRVRLNRVKQLLTETDFPLSRVAEKIGLEHPEYLNVIFKIKIGMTPAQFRATSRVGPAAGRLAPRALTRVRAVQTGMASPPPANVIAAL